MDLAGHTMCLPELPVGRSDRPACCHRAMGCTGSCFHMHIFNFKIHLYPELLL